MKPLTTIELLNKLKIESLKGDNQELINDLAIELANRIYVSNSKQSYQDMIETFGYVELNNKHKEFIRKKRFNEKR